ncbi:hypothetical protein FACS189415_6070 [Bacteroidia bacterium]|nr:hypothetical protein FACS189426_21340 [Bacteroidia bacterium]GHT85570.1 hypothetical protein FACS18947_4490 [Bacteroidia bacterium]GHU83551.1 hypothetical protein FACS189415_6070 [Bacteroidia bacterium]
MNNRRDYSGFVNIDTTIHIYKNLASDNQLPILDYSNDELSMDRTYFYNSEHLNSKGADIFTKKLLVDLDTIRP